MFVITENIMKRPLFYILCACSWNKKKKLTARMQGVESFRITGHYFMSVCALAEFLHIFCVFLSFQVSFWLKNLASSDGEL